MEVRSEIQRNPIADDVSSLVAVTRPILAGLLHSIAEEQLEPHGGREKILLKHLGRVRKANDGDLGVAFEYAVHEAIIQKNPVVLDRVASALEECKIAGDPQSILFAMEKNGSKQLLLTQRDLITSQSRVLSGKPGQPAKLQKHMNQLAAAFHKPTTRLALPQSIRGLWKADLFLGAAGPDQWVGTSIRINRKLESAAGLRVAIVPIGGERSDKIYRDEQRNLIVCPLPHDFSFMQTFYEGMRIIQSLLEKDFRAPEPAQVPNPSHREVARMYSERREFSVRDVLDAIRPFAQPELLEPETEKVQAELFETETVSSTGTISAPIARIVES